jgi:NADH-quinone oxidoreductase subunit N
VIAAALRQPTSISAFQAMLPTTFLLLAALLSGLAGWLWREVPPLLHRPIGLAGLLAAIATTVITYRGIKDVRGTGVADFGGSVVADHFATFAVILLCGIGVMALLSSGLATPRLGSRTSAYHSLVLVATAGGTILAVQWEMAMLITGLALLVPSLAAIVALEKSSEGPGEAAFRQLVVAGAAVALLVYGLAIVYGATGSTDLAATRSGVAASSAPLEGLGLALTLLGLAYLVGVVPLHQGLLQVGMASEGVVAGAVAGLSIASGGIVLIRVFASGFGADLHPWVVVAVVLAAIACLYPALASLGTRTVRGLIGWGTSMQGGLLVAALVGSGFGIDGRLNGGVEALLFGLVAFVLAVLVSFQSVAIVESAGVGGRWRDIRGLARRSPLGAGLLTAGLCGLAGLPPLVGGLVARVLIAVSAVDARYAWLALVVVIASILYAIPVLRALAAIFIEDEEAPAVTPLAPRLARLTAGACAVLGVLVAVFAGPLIFATDVAANSLH